MPIVRNLNIIIDLANKPRKRAPNGGFFCCECKTFCDAPLNSDAFETFTDQAVPAIRKILQNSIVQLVAQSPDCPDTLGKQVGVIMYRKKLLLRIIAKDGDA